MLKALLKNRNEQKKYVAGMEEQLKSFYSKFGYMLDNSKENT